MLRFFQKKKTSLQSLDLVIRQGKLSDVQDIAKLINSLHPMKDISPYVSRTIKDIESKNQRQITVATVNDVLVGYGRCRFCGEEMYAHQGPLGWYLMGLIVYPEFQKRGIGQKITKFRLDWISNRAEEVFYITNESNKISISLHEKLGFQEIERAPGFMNVSFADERSVLFRKSL